jgi:hypothetical protein
MGTPFGELIIENEALRNANRDRFRGEKSGGLGRHEAAGVEEETAPVPRRGEVGIGRLLVLPAIHHCLSYSYTVRSPRIIP